MGSYHIIYNPVIRDRVKKESSLSHYNEMNVLSMYALIGAYQQEGYEWTDELCKVLTKNAEYAYDYIRSHFKGVQVAMPQGTYMLLLDCTEWCRKHGITIDELQHRCDLAGWQPVPQPVQHPHESGAAIFTCGGSDGASPEVCICVEVKKILQRERTDKSKGVLLGKIIRPMTGWKI